MANPPPTEAGVPICCSSLMCKRTRCLATSIAVVDVGDPGGWGDPPSVEFPRLGVPCIVDVVVVTRTSCLAPPP